MKWLDKWIGKKVKQAWDEANKPARDALVGGGHKTISTSPRVNGMQFTVYPANGGHVLEYNYYDPKTDRHNNSLHLINADQNMGDMIGHAITLEMLKR
jgi:hypothetical protein